jgi:hypothetical protein
VPVDDGDQEATGEVLRLSVLMAWLAVYLFYLLLMRVVIVKCVEERKCPFQHPSPSEKFICLATHEV